MKSGVYFGAIPLLATGALKYKLVYAGAVFKSEKRFLVQDALHRAILLACCHGHHRESERQKRQGESGGMRGGMDRI